MHRYYVESWKPRFYAKYKKQRKAALAVAK
jgi:hypothetical protein